MNKTRKANDFMKIAIMQPYFFPYLGYFQLINAVDKFVFYDDVNFIKRGWINRNRILINNNPKYITLQLEAASQNKLINEITLNSNNSDKVLKSIEMAYKKAPFYNSVFPIIKDILTWETNKVSDLAIYSVKEICKYLEVNTTFEISSEVYPETKGLEKAQRIKAICNKNQAEKYINPIGGIDLYNKDDFKQNGIDLFFLKGRIDEYQQFADTFIPGLSIIDVMMFNPLGKIHEMLDNYELV
ncbi:MAG: WbqC family protein [bacterium]